MESGQPFADFVTFDSYCRRSVGLGSNPTKDHIEAVAIRYRYIAEQRKMDGTRSYGFIEVNVGGVRHGLFSRRWKVWSACNHEGLQSWYDKGRIKQGMGLVVTRDSRYQISWGNIVPRAACTTCVVREVHGTSQFRI